MELKIWRIDKELPMPKYSTEGSVAFDLFSREDIVIPPKSARKVPLNVIIQVPRGHALLILPRSSLFIKKGLLMANSVGIIDWDYCGKADEVMALLYNPGDEEAIVRRGERIAQALLVKIERPEIRESPPEERSRGGFGSTGGYL